MFGKHTPTSQQPPEPSKGPLSDYCGQRPALAGTTALGWMCLNCWKDHYVPTVQKSSRWSMCCPACAIRQGKWLAAQFTFGWRLCAEHHTRIQALVLASATDTSLDQDVLLWWHKYIYARHTPIGEQTDD